MTTFELVGHTIIPESRIVEVWRDGRLVAALYPTPTGFKIISKYRLVDVLDEQDPWHQILIEIDP